MDGVIDLRDHISFELSLLFRKVSIIEMVETLPYFWPNVNSKNAEEILLEDPIPIE